MSVTRRGLDHSRFRKYAAVSVKAGVLESATYPADTLTNAATGEQVPDPRAGMKVATIARALHYGVGQNHPRPFLAQTVVQHKKEWVTGFVKLAVAGVTPLNAAQQIGQVMKEDIQQSIQQWPADNSASWAKFKGFSHGLVLTGHLTNSIEFEANKK